MNLATPLGLGAALLAVPLLLWYVLRSRRPRVRVASTFLWSGNEAAATAAVPWQRFRPDATFWLTLLAVLAGALALSRPWVPVQTVLGDHTILVLDASASMLADEGGADRLTLARREAEKLVASLGPGQTVSIVEAADRARVVLSASGEVGAVRRALGDVRPSQGQADLSDAFTLATALQRPGQTSAIHLFTDGVVPSEHAAAMPPDLRVTAVGQDRTNLAVTRMEAVPLGGGSAQVFAQVRNFGTLATAVRVRVLGGGAELDSREVHLLPRGSADLVIEVRLPAADEGSATVLHATVEPLDGPGDALALDDRASAVVTGSRDVTALVAGPGNVFLTSALAAVKGVEVRTAERVPTDLTGIDLLVVDRVAAPAQPSLPTLMIAPTAAADGVDPGDPVDLPVVTFQEPGHDLLRDVDLSGIAIAEARPVSAAALQPVAAGPDGALIAAGRIAGQPVVHLAFDLMASNLPLEVAWPVLIANTVAWLTGPPAAGPVAAGAEVTLALPAGVTGVEVSPPSGDPVRLDATVPRLRLDQIGVWQPRWLGPTDVVEAVPPPPPIAVNAVESEGDLSREAPPPAPVDAPPTAASPLEGRRVFGPGLLAVVLALLFAEWVHAHRRGRISRRTRRGRAVSA